MSGTKKQIFKKGNTGGQKRVKSRVERKAERILLLYKFICFSKRLWQISYEE